MPKGTEACKDIGRQLIEDEPGRSFNVSTTLPPEGTRVPDF